MNLKRLRSKLGLSQAALAKLVGAHAMTVSKWERGVSAPNEAQTKILRSLLRAAERGAVLDEASVHRDSTRALAHAFDHAYREPEIDLGTLSATNRFAGKVVELKRGDVMSKLVIEVAPDVRIGSVITTDSVDRLGLSVGVRAVAIIKATEFIVGRS